MSLLFLEQLGKCLMTWIDCSDKLEHLSEVYHGWPVPFFGAASLESAAKILAREVKYLGGGLNVQLLYFSQSPANYHTHCAQLSAPATDLWGEDKGIGIRFQTLCSSAIGCGYGTTELVGLLGDSTLQKAWKFYAPSDISLSLFCSFLYLYR